MRWRIILIIAMLGLFTGCAEKSKDIAFETVEKGQYKFYEIKNMEFMVIISQEEFNSFLQKYGIENKDLPDWQSDRYILICAFQGMKPTAGYDIEITKIERSGDTVTVKLRIREPKPDEITAQVITSPVHIVKVERSALSGAKTFVFVDQNDRILKKLTLE